MKALAPVLTAAALLGHSLPALAGEEANTAPTATPWSGATISLGTKEKRFFGAFGATLGRGWTGHVSASAPLDEDSRLAPFLGDSRGGRGFEGRLGIEYGSTWSAAALEPNEFLPPDVTQLAETLGLPTAKYALCQQLNISPCDGPAIRQALETIDGFTAADRRSCVVLGIARCDTETLCARPGKTVHPCGFEEARAQLRSEAGQIGPADRESCAVLGIKDEECSEAGLRQALGLRNASPLVTLDALRRRAAVQLTECGNKVALENLRALASQVAPADVRACSSLGIEPCGEKALRDHFQLPGADLPTLLQRLRRAGSEPTPHDEADCAAMRITPCDRDTIAKKLALGTGCSDRFVLDALRREAGGLAAPVEDAPKVAEAPKPSAQAIAAQRESLRPGSELHWAVGLEFAGSYDRPSVYENDLGAAAIDTDDFTVGASLVGRLFSGGLVVQIRPGVERDRSVSASSIDRCTPAPSSDPTVSGKVCKKVMLLDGPIEASTAFHVRTSWSYYLLHQPLGDYLPGVEVWLNAERVGTQAAGLDARLLFFLAPASDALGLRSGIGLAATFPFHDAEDGSSRACSVQALQPFAFVGASFDTVGRLK